MRGCGLITLIIIILMVIVPELGTAFLEFITYFFAGNPMMVLGAVIISIITGYICYVVGWNGAVDFRADGDISKIESVRQDHRK
jgi:cell division protein FtsW (lipid II flippase)